MEEELEGDMTPRLIGETYMKYPAENSTRKYRYGLYECQYCGKEFEAIIKNVKRGYTKSCGCQKGGITHGLSHNQFYKTWKNSFNTLYVVGSSLIYLMRLMILLVQLTLKYCTPYFNAVSIHYMLLVQVQENEI